MQPLTTHLLDRRIIYSAAASVAVLVATGLIFLVQVKPITAHALQAVGGVESPLATPRIPMHEIHVANNGLTLLRGATVDSMSGDVIKVSMEIGTSAFIWKIEFDSATKFISSAGAPETSAQIKQGDVVMITGTLLANDAQPTIHALYIRSGE